MSLQSFLEMKVTDFDAQVQSMNRWMYDSEKLINSLHVGMDPNEVSKRVQQIKVGELSLPVLPISKGDKNELPIYSWESLLIKRTSKRSFVVLELVPKRWKGPLCCPGFPRKTWQTPMACRETTLL